MGGVIFGKIGQVLRPTVLFSLCLGLIGSLLLIMYNFRFLGVALLALFLIGVPAIGAGVSSQVLLQNGVAANLRGRVFGAFATTAALSMLSGQGLAVVLVDRLSLVAILNAAGGLYIAAAVVATILVGQWRLAPDSGM